MGRDTVLGWGWGAARERCNAWLLIISSNDVNHDIIKLMNNFINTALFINQFGYVTQLTNKSRMLHWMSLVNSTDEKKYFEHATCNLLYKSLVH